MGKGIAGSLSKITLGTDPLITIGGISEHKVKRSIKEADDSEYGISWEKFLLTLKSADGSLKGKMRADDDGQAALEAYYEAGTLIPDMRFYYGPNIYLTPDLVADPDAGVGIKDLDLGSSLQGVCTVDLTYKFSGPVKKVSV